MFFELDSQDLRDSGDIFRNMNNIKRKWINLEQHCGFMYLERKACSDLLQGR